MTDLALEPAEITAPFVILSEGQWPRVPEHWPWHTHSVHELVWVRHGTMTTRIRTDDGEHLFTVPEGRGVWLPAGVHHAGQLTAVAVVAVGTVGFVGLVALHLARSLVGARHGRVIPVSMLLGAVLVGVADILGRTLIAPSQIPVGLMIALIGAPYFVWLLRKS